MALVSVWEHGGRMCGRLLIGVIGELVEALGRHGELQLHPEVRVQLLRMSATTIDRRLRPVRTAGGVSRAASRVPAGLTQEVPVRIWAEWEAVEPEELQGDLVLHCGDRAAGSYLATLVAMAAATGCVVLEPLRESLRVPRGGRPAFRLGASAGGVTHAARRQRRGVHQPRGCALAPRARRAALPWPQLPQE